MLQATKSYARSPPAALTIGHLRAEGPGGVLHVAAEQLAAGRPLRRRAIQLLIQELLHTHTWNTTTRRGGQETQVCGAITHGYIYIYIYIYIY